MHIYPTTHSILSNLTQQEITLEIPHCTVSGQLFTRTDNTSNHNLAIAFHGWLDNSNSFLPLIKHLSQLLPASTFKYIVAVDMPGCGKSTHKPVISYPVIESVYDIKQIVDRIQAGLPNYNSTDKFTYIGHSLGGNHSLLYVSMYPQKVKQLILLDALGYFTAEASEGPITLLSTFEKRQRADLREAKGIGKKVFSSFEELAQSLAKTYKHGLKLESARILAQRGSIQVHDDGWQHSYDLRHLALGFYALTEDQVLAFLVRLTTVPILLLFPQEGGWPFGSRFTMKRRLELLNKVNPHFTRVTVKGVYGHHFHIDYPSETAHAILDYYSTIIDDEDDDTIIRSRM
jgi:pimeloyl-ACP methyl ester carboxylesterase